MSEKDRLVRMLKDNETTSKSDYLAVKLQPIVTTKWVPKATCHRIRPPPLKDTHSMTNWKVPKVPFDLYWKGENNVTGANPHVPQKPYKTPVDEDRERVQHTRPRLVMTPAIALDDIEEPVRQTLLDDVYTTAEQHLMRSTRPEKAPELRIVAPLPATFAPSQPIVLGKLTPPYVSPAWRMESVSWEAKASRAYVAPTREFWLRREPKNTKTGRKLKSPTS